MVAKSIMFISGSDQTAALRLGSQLQGLLRVTTLNDVTYAPGKVSIWMLRYLLEYTKAKVLVGKPIASVGAYLAGLGSTLTWCYKSTDEYDNAFIKDWVDWGGVRPVFMQVPSELQPRMPFSFARSPYVLSSLLTPKAKADGLDVDSLFDDCMLDHMLKGASFIELLAVYYGWAFVRENFNVSPSNPCHYYDSYRS